jgi:hypothetical protein
LPGSGSKGMVPGGPMIDVFLSRPTGIGESFVLGTATLSAMLYGLGLRPRTLRDSAPPVIDHVMAALDACDGVLVLGVPQIDPAIGAIKGPTEWNHIEAVLGHAKGLPLLVVAHDGVVGGVFDARAVGPVVQHADLQAASWPLDARIASALWEWRGRVAHHGACRKRLVGRRRA